MKTLGKTLMSTIGLAAMIGALPAHAALGDSLVATGGDVTIRFEGSNAGYNSLISVNGSAEFYPNHATAPGPLSDINLGSFAAGTAIDVILHVITTGLFFQTGPGGLNPDGIPHAWVTQLNGRTMVSFEDLLGGGDQDYNDHMFSLTGVSIFAVPEPSLSSMMLAGLGVLGFLGLRRRKG